jgi:DNA-binding NtrC family response regulator
MTHSNAEPVQIEIDAKRVLLTRSRAMHRVWEIIQRAAPLDVSVLITGETGTGKELVARLIHRLSRRAGREFVALDCNAIPPTLLESELFGHERGAFTGAERERAGMFELANGATLLLDEIANLPLEAQAKLLRVLQEGEFRRLGGRKLVHSDFRLITATNADLGLRVRAGAFRDDLFHRVSVVRVRLPPLRERREDIPLLVRHFVGQTRLRLERPNVCRVSHAALDLLLAYDWPGNVRELEHVIETAIVECPGDTIESAHVVLRGSEGPERASGDGLDLSYPEARSRVLADFERWYLLALFRQYRGSLKQVAAHARISTKHVRALTIRHGIDRREYREESGCPRTGAESLVDAPAKLRR